MPWGQRHDAVNILVVFQQVIRLDPGGRTPDYRCRAIHRYHQCDVITRACATISAGVPLESQSVSLWDRRLRRSQIRSDRAILFGVGEGAIVGVNMRACVNRLGGLPELDDRRACRYRRTCNLVA